jgi:cell division protein FtsW (lipid II flippase)
MNICLFDCEKNIDIFLFFVFYLAVSFSVIFIESKVVKGKPSYGSKEFYFLSYYVFPVLIFLRFVFNLESRVGFWDAVLIFIISGIVRLCLLRKKRNRKDSNERTN